jgi:hypothetical protein
MSSGIRPIIQCNATLYPWGWVEYTECLNKSDYNRSITKPPNSLVGDNLHDGYLSLAAQKRLKAAINMLAFIANDKRLYPDSLTDFTMFKLNLITLTLPSRQVHSDTEIKKLLIDPMLKSLKYHFGLNNYIWKSERQDNNNIHFHITTDCYIPHEQLRTMWNHQLSRYGYIESYRINQEEKHRDGFYYDKRQYTINKLTLQHEAISYKEQKRRYKEGTANRWTNPNSSDIHMVINVDNLAAYMSAYLSKKDYWKKDKPIEIGDMLEKGKDKTAISCELVEGYRDFIKAPIDGKIWDCSTNLKKSGLKIDDVSRFQNEFKWMKKNQIAKVIPLDFCTIYIKEQSEQRKFPNAIRSLVLEHIEMIKYDCCNLTKHYEQIRQDNAIQELLVASCRSTEPEREMQNIKKHGRLYNSRSRQRTSKQHRQTTINFKL